MAIRSIISGQSWFVLITGVNTSMQLVTIQYLRAVAALMVVIYHLQPQLQRMEGFWQPGYWMMSGVDIFFVISGFIMWWTTRDAEIRPGRFMKRRILRIVPIYWALTLLYVVVLLVAPSLMQTGGLDLRHAISSFLFIPAIHPVLGEPLPLVTPGWTLNYEMFFYVIFALCLLLPRQVQHYAITAALVGLVAIGFILQPANLILATYTSTLLLEFLFGVVIAELILRRIALPSQVIIPVVLLGFMGLPLLNEFTTQDTRAFYWGIPAAMIVYGAVSYEMRHKVGRNEVMLYLGAASYSIYITHQLTMSAIGQGWRMLVPHPSMFAYFTFCVLCVLIAVAIGCLAYRFMEIPLNRLARRLFDNIGAGVNQGAKLGDRPRGALNEKPGPA